MVRRGLHGWFAQMPGRLVMEAEAQLVASVLPNLFGYHLLQVGSPGDADLSQSSRIRNRVLLATDQAVCVQEAAAVCGHATALPVASDCLDVLLLPHVLEFEVNPHETLREAERVLVPEGHVVITGFNPWSLFGGRRLVPGARRHVPWYGSFLGLTRIKDWLALLGFDIVVTRCFFFRPPFANEGVMERLHLFDTLGGRFWPYLGGLYLVVARKRVITLTPIKPRWRSRRSLVTTGLAEPTARSRL